MSMWEKLISTLCFFDTSRQKLRMAFATPQNVEYENAIHETDFEQRRISSRSACAGHPGGYGLCCRLCRQPVLYVQASSTAVRVAARYRRVSLGRFALVLFLAPQSACGSCWR